MTITLPNGDVQVADAVIYDESTKTYNIDSHDTTNNNITYNYSWTYHINYTSITYIGQTEQYDKYYKVYYELPDGRDSADLTAEDLEQLNFDIDVVNYGRYSDNASIRCLYHFDGDTRIPAIGTTARTLRGIPVQALPIWMPVYLRNR
jgi:hypothetical protein